MDIEKVKLLFNDFFENRPSKEVYEKCLMDIIVEKQNIISKEQYDKNLIDQLDKVIDSIEQYLTISSK
jgi:hypothetical protein